MATGTGRARVATTDTAGHQHLPIRKQRRRVTVVFMIHVGDALPPSNPRTVELRAFFAFEHVSQPTDINAFAASHEHLVVRQQRRPVVVAWSAKVAGRRPYSPSRLRRD